MIHLLIRADDLGYSEGVNYGIAKTVTEGLVKSVGVMVNMPATVHGLRLLRGATVSLGQHTNICAGKPLCDPKLIPSLTDQEGSFKSSKVYRQAGRDIVEVDEAVLEIEAQYQRFKILTGQEPDYFEGHAIFSQNFMRALQMVAQDHGLKFSGFSFDGSPLDIAGRKVRTIMKSMDKDYNPAEALKGEVSEARDGDYLMFIAHPGYLDNYILQQSSLTLPRAQEVDMLCDPDMRSWLEGRGIDLIAYRDL